MADLDPLWTVDDLAARYGKSTDWIRRRMSGWPHVRLGRTSRFTSSQVLLIDQMQSEAPTEMKPHSDWGRSTRAS